MTVPHVPILSPAQLPISLGTPLDGRSKTVVSDLINLYGFGGASIAYAVTYLLYLLWASIYFGNRFKFFEKG